MNLPRRMFAEIAGGEPFFGAVRVSGGHLASMGMVAAGEADAAAIDCVTFGFCGLHRPDLTARLRVIGRTAASPAIPFITASATPPGLAAALTRALRAPGVLAALAALRITHVAPARPEAYEAVLRFEAEAAAMGYPLLA
jgi:ABC-type phosphate/phosphonate transport system substrate-binding protein